jgi:hypothetical protein
VIVLSHASPIACACHITECITASLEGCLVDLAVAFDNVDHNVARVDELGDVQGSLVPSHDGALIFEGLDKGHGCGRGHREPLLLGKFLAALLIDRLTQLAQIFN